MTNLTPEQFEMRPSERIREIASEISSDNWLKENLLALTLYLDEQWSYIRLSKERETHDAQKLLDGFSHNVSECRWCPEVDWQKDMMEQMRKSGQLKGKTKYEPHCDKCISSRNSLDGGETWRESKCKCFCHIKK